MESFPDTPWVRIIIVNYNSGDYLEYCMDGLLKQTFQEFEVVVIDNGSVDGSLENLEISDPRFRIINAGKNLGFAKANNIGAEGCCAPWIATLNPDAVPEEKWLEALRDATLIYTKAAMFGSTQLMLEDRSRLDGCGDVYSFLGMPWRGGHGHPVNIAPADGHTFSPCAAAALYRREAFVEVGGFDESFFCYLEDVDLGFRLRLQGEICIQVRGAIVGHEGSASSGRRSYFTVYHSARNRIWVLIKNMPLALLIVLLPLHFLATVWLLFRVRDSDWRKAMIAGVRAGVTDMRRVWRMRAKIQRQRRISTIRVARALNWNINALRERRPDVRAIL